MKYQHAGVVGTGSWGTALAVLLAERGLDVSFLGRTPETVDAINKHHENPRYLPQVSIPDSVRATADPSSLLDCEFLVLVVPSSVLRNCLDRLLAQKAVPAGAPIISCIKGIEQSSCKRMTEVIQEVLPGHPALVLSGPNHAEEVALHMATAAVIGCDDANAALAFQDVFTLPWFRTYTSDDVAGIEYGGAIKNVFAIAAGICEGLGLGDNAKAALTTRALSEMVRLGTTLGGKPETFQGLSGIGDLIVTCYSAHSRNNRVGKMLGRGHSLEVTTSALNMVAEGVLNTLSIYHCAKDAGVRTPLIDAVHAILYESKPAAEAMSELLTRDPRPEFDR